MLERKPKMAQHHPNKAPFQKIIGLFQVNFNHHVPIISFPLLKWVDQLLGNYHIISTPPTSQKSSLHWRYQGM